MDYSLEIALHQGHEFTFILFVEDINFVGQFPFNGVYEFGHGGVPVRHHLVVLDSGMGLQKVGNLYLCQCIVERLCVLQNCEIFHEAPLLGESVSVDIS